MIDIETVFVLGAGSAKPYGFPTGDELRRSIIDNNTVFTQILNRYDFEYENKLLNLKKIKDCFLGSNLSIDKFLSVNSGNRNFELFGKCSIISTIINYERCSLKKFIPKRKEDEANENWYVWLYKYLIEDFSSSKDYFENITNHKLKIITFNYDRSLEFFLLRSVQNSFVELFDKKLKEIPLKKIIGIPIIHTYGTVGELDNERDYFGYGIQPRDIISEYTRIKTIYTEREKNSEIEKYISEAKRVFFLGFGFAPENMELLGGYNALQEKEVYITFYKESEEFIQKQKNIFEKYNVKIIGKPYSCLELLRNYL